MSSIFNRSSIVEPNFMGIFKFDLLYSHSGLEGSHVTLMSLRPREHKGFIKGFEIH